MNEKDFKTWYTSSLSKKLESTYDVSIKSFANGQFGDLISIEFNNSQRGGYIQFWSDGYLGFHLVNYEIGEEVVKETLIKAESNAGECLRDFLLKI